MVILFAFAVPLIRAPSVNLRAVLRQSANSLAFLAFRTRSNRGAAIARAESAEFDPVQVRPLRGAVHATASERHAVDATLAIAIARATTTSMADGGNVGEIPAAAAAIAIGDHPDDAEIAATDSAILSPATRADYTRRMTAMEGYFRQNKATAMFADGHTDRRRTRPA